jgi:hypothetical protein
LHFTFLFKGPNEGWKGDWKTQLHSDLVDRINSEILVLLVPTTALTTMSFLLSLVKFVYAALVLRGLESPSQDGD